MQASDKILEKNSKTDISLEARANLSVKIVGQLNQKAIHYLSKAVTQDRSGLSRQDMAAALQTLGPKAA